MRSIYQKSNCITFYEKYLLGVCKFSEIFRKFTCSSYNTQPRKSRQQVCRKQ